MQRGWSLARPVKDDDLIFVHAKSLSLEQFILSANTILVICILLERHGLSWQPYGQNQVTETLNKQNFDDCDCVEAEYLVRRGVCIAHGTYQPIR